MLRHLLTTAFAALLIIAPLDARQSSRRRVPGGATAVPEIGRGAGRTALTLILSGALLLTRGKSRE